MSAWYAVANAAEIPSPTILLYPDRIRENLLRMIRLAGGVERLRPHVKTHKLPQVVRLKLELGITKFKTATIAEAEMTAAAGGRDVLLAYPLVGPNVRRFMRLITTFPETRFSTVVDHPASLAALSAAATAAGVTAHVYLDLNVGMERTGIVAGDAAAALYRQMCAAPGIKPAGLHAYDGQLVNTDLTALRASVAAAFAPVWRLKEELIAAGCPVPKVIASGTPTFPQFGGHPEVEVGCGTTVLWDTGQAEACPDLDFLNAAVLLTRVISLPGPNRVCVDLGHKAVAAEMPWPRATFLNLEVTKFLRHSEEHLVLETSTPGLQPGDVLYAIPRHICPTMAVHQAAWVVRNGVATETWPIVARARTITV
jgi:D-serine deaminase-like pyridoxal phosphate-dependent protein